MSIEKQPYVDDGKSPGLYTPLPLCVDRNKCPTLRSYIEEGELCRKCGGVGVGQAPFGVPRHRLMFFAGGVSVFGLVLLIVSCCAISVDPDTLRNTAWASGTVNDGSSASDGLSVYIGLKM